MHTKNVNEMVKCVNGIGRYFERRRFTSLLVFLLCDILIKFNGS